MLLPSPLNDSELLRLASTPPKVLFVTPSRISAFAPLILVCCALPAVALVINPILSEESSLWALRSLGVANASTMTAVLRPGSTEAGQPLIFQPPLAAWLNGAVVWLFGPSQAISSSGVSLAATALSIWLITRLAGRTGRASSALIAGIFLCSHPLVLQMAVTPSNGALALFLTLATVHQFARHLQGPPNRISVNLVFSGVAWGFLVLAIGPVALTLPVLFLILGLSGTNTVRSESASPPQMNRSLDHGHGQKAVLVLTAIGTLISGWWNLLMFSEHGGAFWYSWMTSLPVECLAQGNSEWRCDLRPILQPTWHDWLFQNALLVGWTVLGVTRSWHEGRSSNNPGVRQQHVLFLTWFLVAASGHIVAEIIGQLTATNLFVWNLALLSPTVLLSVVGVESVMERVNPRLDELLVMVLLVALAAWRLSMIVLTAFTAGAAALLLLTGAPMLTHSTVRRTADWTAAEWRRLLQVTVCTSLVACLILGFRHRSVGSAEIDRFGDLRSRLASLPEVRRISLISSNEPVPVTLRHLLRSRWPRAELVASEGWDPGLTREMAEESISPHSRFLVLEWAPREVRLSTDTGHAWKISSVGDPIRIHGQQLSLALIAPRSASNVHGL